MLFEALSRRIYCRWKVGFVNMLHPSPEVRGSGTRREAVTTTALKIPLYQGEKSNCAGFSRLLGRHS